VPGASPTVRRRELGARLRALRVAAGRSIEEVAAEMEISPAKISRIETAARGGTVSVADLRLLCAIYRVPAQEQEALLSLGRESKQTGWWQKYGLPGDIATYVGLEDAATSILQYLTSLVPPLLQTESYARAVASGIEPWLSDDEIEHRVGARLDRQALLTSERPPELWAIVDEAALHRLVGGPAVMGEQLDALVQRSRPPRVTLQVIALEAGAHVGMDSTFTVLRLEEVDDVVYVEGLAGNLILESKDDLARYGRAFDHLQAAALSPKDSRDRITAISAALPT
jgi:transcriptional regulator with XRE-family HTH domain